MFYILHFSEITVISESPNPKAHVMGMNSGSRKATFPSALVLAKQHCPEHCLSLKNGLVASSLTSPWVPKIHKESGYKELLWHHNYRLWNPKETSVTEDRTLTANIIQWILVQNKLQEIIQNADSTHLKKSFFKMPCPNYSTQILTNQHDL